MSETKRIRYKSVADGVTGPLGAVVHNEAGVWEPGDVRDVHPRLADSYVKDGGFEFTDAETKEETAKRLEAEAAKKAEADAKKAEQKKPALTSRDDPES